jgi:hypothetical protein
MFYCIQVPYLWTPGQQIKKGPFGGGKVMLLCIYAPKIVPVDMASTILQQKHHDHGAPLQGTKSCQNMMRTRATSAKKYYR